MKKHDLLSILFLGAGLALSGCGGGGGGSGSSAPQLSGTAATGAAIINGIVEASCSDGSGFTAPVTTNAQGKWTGTLNDEDVLPCALRVTDEAGDSLYSFAKATGTINISPLTTLAIARTTGQAPDVWYNGGSVMNFEVDAYDSAANDILTALRNADYQVPASGSPFTTAFNANGTGWDGLLDQIGSAVDDFDTLVASVAEGSLDFPEAPEPADNDHEAAAENIELITRYAGTYQVACSAVTPEAIGPGNREHQRGSIIISNNGTIDYDTGIKFSASDINQLFDRTHIDSDAQRRVHINYDENDSGRQINIYLNADSSVAEVRYQDGSGNVTRAAIDSARCDTTNDDDNNNGNNGNNDTDATSAIKAAAGNYAMRSIANGVSSSDIGSERRLTMKNGFNACESLGYIPPQSHDNKNAVMWPAEVTVDAATARITLTNPDQSNHAFSLKPGSVGEDDTTTLKEADQFTFSEWKAAHPDGKVYEYKRTVRYMLEGHPGKLQDLFTMWVALLDNKVERIQMLSGATEHQYNCSGELEPAPMDELAPIKALAGSYTKTRDIATTASDWSSMSINTDGSLTFQGDGPSFSAADIRQIQLHERNSEGLGKGDSPYWAISILLDMDLTGDGNINNDDAINLYLTNTGELRDMAYRTGQGPFDYNEVSFVTTELPEYNTTLASDISGDGITGLVGEEKTPQINNVDQWINFGHSISNQHFLALATSPDTSNPGSWQLRLTLPNQGLLAAETYACSSQDKVEYQPTNVFAQNTKFRYSSLGGGTCEFQITNVTADGTDNVQYEGLFRAIAWNHTTTRFEPLTGFFRVSK